MSQSVVGEGKRITLNFALKLENGEVVDTTFGKIPATFDFGDENLPEHFSRLLVGMAAGETGEFTVLPENAFGQHNPSNVQRFKRDQFAADMPLEKGMIISFQDAAKAEVPGVVHEIEESNVVIDFNHPLAGKTLVFEAEILRVEDSVPDVG
ncbi:MAG: peptidylprolyl isomerase [Hahellaceae bacterium]|jgi:FKBP-type peptidyl-prolyl cis-trans isomerase SlpA|nr:peptidylprolyl isomerase [Hahellaceae bacterium]MCP5210632.1 peptidylprolyl isomerase [Hahellaceae bacterium]